MDKTPTIIQEKIKGLREMVETTKVTNEKELAEVSDKVKIVKEAAKYIKDEKDKFVAPAKAIIDEAKKKYDPYLKECDNAEIILKQRAMEFMQKQEEERKKKEAKIAADLEKGKIDTDKALSKIEKLPEAQKSVDTGESKLQMKKTKVAVIKEPEKIPDEFWVIDEVRVRKEALEREKNGLPQIPGVVIEEKASIASI